MLKLKVRRTVGKAFSQAEKDRMLEEASKARSPHIYPALVLALPNAGDQARHSRREAAGQDRTRIFRQEPLPAVCFGAHLYRLRRTLSDSEESNLVSGSSGNESGGQSRNREAAAR
jgi:hypothetical protein